MGERATFRASKAGHGRPHRWAGRGLLLGVSSALAVGGAPATAGAQTQEPTAFINCEAGSSVGARVTGFPPQETFTFIAVATSDAGSRSVYQGLFISTDETGAGSTLRTTAGIPLTVAFAVYRDTNLNGRWDPGSDDTVYRGDGRLVDCPQEVALTPK